MKQLVSKDDFLVKYNIKPEDFVNSTLKWDDLSLVYVDYCKNKSQLESSAVYMFNELMKLPNVHSVRYRVKDEEHLIEKIIRKRIKNPAEIITIDNYQTILTDLIGVRALHLFKSDWNLIHEAITNTWETIKKPVANYRKGDSDEYKRHFEELDCDINEHPFGYRSVHYIVTTKPAKKTHYVEIQVRTIFEEAWSEIDHTIRYPYDQDNLLFGQFLLILNRLAGSADEMGAYVQLLKSELQKINLTHLEEMSAKDQLVKELEAKVSQLNLPKADSDFLTDGIEKLNKKNIDIGAALRKVKPLNISQIGIQTTLLDSIGNLSKLLEVTGGRKYLDNPFSILENSDNVTKSIAAAAAIGNVNKTLNAIHRTKSDE